MNSIQATYSIKTILDDNSLEPEFCHAILNEIKSPLQ